MTIFLMIFIASMAIATSFLMGVIYGSVSALARFTKHLRKKNEELNKEINEKINSATGDAGMERTTTPKDWSERLPHNHGFWVHKPTDPLETKTDGGRIVRFSINAKGKQP